MVTRQNSKTALRGRQWGQEAHVEQGARQIVVPGPCQRSRSSVALEAASHGNNGAEAQGQHYEW